MDAWVYHGRSNREEANTLVAELRDGGEFELVKPVDSRRYGGEIHKGDVVYHDGTRRDLVWANEREGVECRQFAGSEMESDSVASSVASTTKPAAVEVGAPAEGAATVGGPVEEVRQNGQWFTAYRDGEKVGSSKRSEAEARAELGAHPAEAAT